MLCPAVNKRDSGTLQTGFSHRCPAVVADAGRSVWGYWPGRVSNHFDFPRTFPGLALKVLSPRKPFSPRQTGTVDAPLGKQATIGDLVLRENIL